MKMTNVMQQRIARALTRIEEQISELDEVYLSVFNDDDFETPSAQKFDHAIGSLRDGIFDLDIYTRPARNVAEAK